jgi:hypothetical protein
VLSLKNEPPVWRLKPVAAFESKAATSTTHKQRRTMSNKWKFVIAAVVMFELANGFFYGPCWGVIHNTMHIHSAIVGGALTFLLEEMAFVAIGCAIAAMKMALSPICVRFGSLLASRMQPKDGWQLCCVLFALIVGLPVGGCWLFARIMSHPITLSSRFGLAAFTLLGTCAIVLRGSSWANSRETKVSSFGG